MKFSLIFILLAVVFALALSDQCEPQTRDCLKETEYRAYVKCVKDRSKREISCQDEENYSSCENGNCNNDDCQNCDCNSCSNNNCQNSCNNSCCSSCCNVITSCASNSCCHKTCHATCKNSSCRSSCRKSCKENISENTNESKVANAVNNTILNAGNHNITTIIHLNNIINNTNLINVPVHVNSTNFNNITIENRAARDGYREQIILEPSSRPYQPGPPGPPSPPNPPNSANPCCHIIGPRQCVPQEKFPFMRCFHIRKRACGYVCSSPIVHYQKHEICDQDVSNQPCHQQVIYIPQPRPKCAYSAVWPYVNCGGGSQLESCEGCYSHYSEKKLEPQTCSPYCYDDGYGIGPYYRQGPFYRPGYAHAPSCFQTGMCGGGGDGFGGSDYEYGGYGGYGGYGYGGVGYPSVSYGEGPIIESPSYNLTEGEMVSTVLENWNDDKSFHNIKRDPQIDSLIQPPRTVRFAEIKIQSGSKEEEEEEVVSEIPSEGNVETSTENPE